MSDTREPNEPEILHPEEPDPSKQKAKRDSGKFELMADSLAKLAEVQTLEVEVRKQEAAVRQSEIESNERIALATIGAQERSQSTRGQWINRHHTTRCLFIGFLVLVVLGFAGFALLNDGKDLVADTIKLGLTFTAGLFGGFHWGRAKSISSE